MDTRLHGDSMPKGGNDSIIIVVVISIASNDDVVNYFGDAVTQEKSGGLSCVVASEIEIRPPGAPGSNAKGVVEAQIAACLQATIKHGK